MANEIIAGCGYHHIALRTTDIEKSIAFYTKGLGFSLCAAWGEDKRIAMLDMGDGGIIELFNLGEALEKNELQAGSYFHLALKTTNTDTAFAAAVKAGATIKMEPKDVDIKSEPVMKVRIAFVYGPDGEVLEFFQYR